MSKNKYNLATVQKLINNIAKIRYNLNIFEVAEKTAVDISDNTILECIEEISNLLHQSSIDVKDISTKLVIK